MRIEKDFSEFIALLNTHEVRYLLVGGFAFSFYAEPRYTRDIDFLIDTAAGNVERLMSALEDFGFGATGLKATDFQKPGKTVQLGHEPIRIDMLTSIEGVTFREAWPNRVAGKYGGQTVYFISKEDLIRNKRALGRTRDLADIEKLEAI